MIGRTKSPVHGEPDEFTVYGTFSDRALDLAGRPCTVHFGQIVLPAVIDEKRSFHGEITVHYGLVASQIDSCPLACDIAVAYRADLTAP